MMERRLKRLAAVYHGRDAEAVVRCADYLRFAFMVTPTRADAQAESVRGFRTLIDHSGIDPDGTPRALTLALAGHFGGDVALFAYVVAGCGVDTILSAMALPPDHREAFLTGAAAAQGAIAGP